MSDRRRETPTWVFRGVFWASSRESFCGVCVCAVLFSNIFSCQKLNYWKSVRESSRRVYFYVVNIQILCLAAPHTTNTYRWAEKDSTLCKNLVGEVLVLGVAGGFSPSVSYLSYFHFKFVFLTMCVCVCVMATFLAAMWNEMSFSKLVFLPADRISDRIGSVWISDL